jgi:hypothetical protein
MVLKGHRLLAVAGGTGQLVVQVKGIAGAERAPASLAQALEAGVPVSIVDRMSALRRSPARVGGSEVHTYVAVEGAR